MKAIIGTQNPGKVKALEEVLKYYYKEVEVVAINAPSGVPEQPFNQETYQGALNRVDFLIDYAKKNNLDIDYFCGIESGVVNLYDKYLNMNIAVIKDKHGYESYGIGQSFPVPNRHIEDIKTKGLGPFFDTMLNKENLAKGKGGISYLTKNFTNRIEISKNAFSMALIPFVNSENWKD